MLINPVFENPFSSPRKDRNEVVVGVIRDNIFNFPTLITKYALPIQPKLFVLLSKGVDIDRIWLKYQMFDSSKQHEDHMCTNTNINWVSQGMTTI